MDNLALVVNTHSSCSDLWKIFYDQIKKYLPEIKKIYFFTDKFEEELEKLGKEIQVIKYDSNTSYRDQFLESIKKVEEEYFIYTNEDYFLYDNVNWKKIIELTDVIRENNELSFVKLIRGPEFIGKSNRYKNYENLYSLDNNSDTFYSMGATIWRTRDKEKIYHFSPPMHIADKGNMPQFESHAHKICKILNIQGCVYYENEEKRGMYHYDSNVFPYIATALIKGKWNIKEYASELYPLINQYGIDINKRGVF